MLWVLLFFFYGHTSATGNEKQLITCFEGLEPTPQGLCLERIDVPAMAICAGAGDHFGENKCRIRVPKLIQCEDGYVQSPSGECSKEIIIEPSYFCPTGFLDNDNICIQRLPGEIKRSCEEGKLEADQCVIDHILDLHEKISCPDGAKFKENGCWKVVDTFDCTEQFECVKKCFIDNNCRTHGGRQGNSRRNLNEFTDLVPVNAPRPVKINIVKQLCEKEIQVQSIVVRQCPEDFLQINENQCSRQSLKPAISICVETNGSVESCPDIVRTVEKKSKCPEGSVPLLSGKCKRTNVVPGTPYCPSDFVDLGDACVAYVQAPLKCSPDLTLLDGRCVGTRLHSPVTVDTETFQIVAETPHPLPSSKVASRSFMKKGRSRDRMDTTELSSSP